MTTAIKRQRPSTASDIAPGALPLGKRRFLPVALEVECCSFLELNDLADLFFVSKASSQLVRRWLGQMRVLRLGRLWSIDETILRLILGCCRKLEEIHVPLCSEFKALVSLINANRDSLRAVVSPKPPPRSVLTSLLSCPHLDGLRIGDKFPLSNLPRGLRSLILPDRCVSSDVSILTLPLEQFGSLQTLQLSVDMLSAEIASKLAVFFGGLPSLTSLRIAGTINYLDKSSAIWRLPDLLALRLSSSVLPKIEAPQLQTLDVRAQNHQRDAIALGVMLRDLKTITALTVRISQPGNSNGDPAIQRLAASLLNNACPLLQALSVDSECCCTPLLHSLSSKPRPTLRSLHVSLATSRLLFDTLRRNTGLEEVQVDIVRMVKVDSSFEDYERKKAVQQCVSLPAMRRMRLELVDARMFSQDKPFKFDNLVSLDIGISPIRRDHRETRLQSLGDIFAACPKLSHLALRDCEFPSRPDHKRIEPPLRLESLEFDCPALPLSTQHSNTPSPDSCWHHPDPLHDYLSAFPALTSLVLRCDPLLMPSIATVELPNLRNLRLLSSGRLPMRFINNAAKLRANFPALHELGYGWSYLSGPCQVRNGIRYMGVHW